MWDLANSLAQMGHKVVLFAPEGSQVPNNGFLIECPPPELKVQTDWLQAERRMFDYYWDYLKDWAGVIHGHGWFGFEYLAKTKNPQLKVVHSHHGGLNLEFWKRSPPPFKLNMVAISDWMVKVYASQGFTAKRVYNGINLDRYPFKKRKGERFLFLSRISKIKAPHLAIEVAKKANVPLDVVGATNFVDDPSYVEQVRGLCDGEQIRFVGEVSHEDKLRYLQNAKALLVPSSWGEPFGLHVVESMSVGTPVISLRDGGIVETIDNGVTGFLCQDTDEMVKQIKRVELIKPRKCREWVEKNFSREIMASNYIQRFNDILYENKEW